MASHVVQASCSATAPRGRRRGSALARSKAGLAIWALLLAALAGVGILTGGDGLAGTFALVVVGVLVLEGFTERSSRGT